MVVKLAKLTFLLALVFGVIFSNNADTVAFAPLHQKTPEGPQESTPEPEEPTSEPEEPTSEPEEPTSEPTAEPEEPTPEPTGSPVPIDTVDPGEVLPVPGEPTQTVEAGAPTVVATPLTEPTPETLTGPTTTPGATPSNLPTSGHAVSNLSRTIMLLGIVGMVLIGSGLLISWKVR